MNIFLFTKKATRQTGNKTCRAEEGIDTRGVKSQKETSTNNIIKSPQAIVSIHANVREPTTRTKMDRHHRGHLQHLLSQTAQKKRGATKGKLSRFKQYIIQTVEISYREMWLLSLRNESGMYSIILYSVRELIQNVHDIKLKLGNQDVFNQIYSVYNWRYLVKIKLIEKI